MKLKEFLIENNNQACQRWNWLSVILYIGVVEDMNNACNQFALDNDESLNVSVRIRLLKVCSENNNNNILVYIIM